MANDKQTGELLETAAKVIGKAMAESELVRTIPFGIIDPDYARIYTKARIIAWTYGYACCVHGSFTRDLDLVLVPWTDGAKQNLDQVVTHLASVCDLRIYGAPSEKPHGRRAWTLLLPGFGECRWVDLSAFAPVQEARGGD